MIFFIQIWLINVIFFIFVWRAHVLYICMNDASSSYLYERRKFFIFVWRAHVLHICMNDASLSYLYEWRMFFIFVWRMHVLHICMKSACSSYLYKWRMSLTIFKTYWAFSCFYDSKLKKLLKQIMKSNFDRIKKLQHFMKISKW